MNEIIKSDQEKIVIGVKEYEGHKYIDIRAWLRGDVRGEWQPSRKGITVPMRQAGELRIAIDRLFAEDEFKESG